jgi:FdhD protein
METFETIRITDGTITRVAESITEEIPLTIETAHGELATLLASPTDIENLVTGFLYTSGVVRDIADIRSMVIDHERFRALVDLDSPEEDLPFRRVYTSGCGKGVIFHNPIDVLNRTALPDGFTVEGRRLFEMMRDFLRGSREHRDTRGVHSAALASRDTILVFRDDIGRHNAIDKVVGEALSKGWELSDKLILTTGRISSEILSKALRCRIPLIAAAGSPTNQAVRLARVANLTLAKLAKGGITVFSGEKRVI